eukprot:6374947-Pyramimonas_sp.AAC.1
MIPSTTMPSEVPRAPFRDRPAPLPVTLHDTYHHTRWHQARSQMRKRNIIGIRPWSWCVRYASLACPVV